MGLGDGGAHYAAICDASYPTFLLTYWTRDRDGPRLSIPQAVRALTSRPAETMGLRDRGRIAPVISIGIAPARRKSANCH